MPDDIGNSLHDIAHKFMKNTRGLIHSARDFVYNGFQDGNEDHDAKPEYGHKYSSVFSPVLHTCISDSSHDVNIDLSTSSQNIEFSEVDLESRSRNECA
jgi:hypothetical protein